MYTINDKIQNISGRRKETKEKAATAVAVAAATTTTTIPFPSFVVSF